jgi:hypothetical protein
MHPVLLLSINQHDMCNLGRKDEKEYQLCLLYNKDRGIFQSLSAKGGG